MKKNINAKSTPGIPVTSPSCMDINVDQNALNSSTNTLGDTFGTSNEERADIVAKESEGLNSFPTGIASSPSVSFATLTPDANIMKEDVCNILVWMKFHDITITVFTEDGLSVIATKLGNPLMLDSYTAAMCTNSWGRASNARAMVELQADFELKDTIMVETGNKAFTSGEQEEGQRSTPLVERINAFEKQPLEWKCVLVDDNGKPLENVDYSSNQGSEDEVD
uniref:Uncharacterized protein n=1 Tax=Tanacetum cinerariifolium TaxID=118510 RepID=A0A699HCQ5_TANCI|nr:hypothetical protein [Tanacetum cinerariifolium]